MKESESLHPAPRRVVQFRVLLTEACDLRCKFCHNEGQVDVEASLEALPAELISTLSVAKEFGTVTMKFSGGEPTLNPKFSEYVEAASRGGVSDLSVVTNGRHPEQLLDAARRVGGGLRVSVSIPTLVPHEYKQLTGGDLRVVVESVQRLLSTGQQVAVNSFAGPSLTNSERSEELIAWSADYGIRLKFILPCHIVGSSSQERMYAKLFHLITCAGYQPVSRRWHKTIFEGSSNSIELLESWCPRICAEAASEVVSLRIDSKMSLYSCLGLGARRQNFRGSFETRKGILERVIRDLEAGKAHQISRLNPPVVRR